MARCLLVLLFLLQIGCVGFMENVAVGFIGNIVADHITKEIEKNRKEN